MEETHIGDDTVRYLKDSLEAKHLIFAAIETHSTLREKSYKIQQQHKELTDHISLHKIRFQNKDNANIEMNE